MRDTWKRVITLLLVAVTATFLTVAESGEAGRGKAPQSRAPASNVHRPSGERPTPSQPRTLGEVINDKARGGLAEHEGRTSLRGSILREFPTYNRVQSAGDSDKLLHEVKAAIEAIHQAASQNAAKQPDDVVKELNAIRLGELPNQKLEPLFDELNHRLRTSGNQTEREYLYRSSQVLDWKASVARQTVPEGEVTALSKGDQLASGYRPDEPLKGREVPHNEIRKINIEKAPLYIQDSPSLHHLNWSVSIHQSVVDAVIGNLATVIKLPRDDIAHFKPAEIYTGEERFSRVSGNQRETPSDEYRPYQPQRICIDRDTDPGCHVYLVMPKTSSPR